MSSNDNFSMKKRIELECNKGVVVCVDFCNIPKESRNQIEEAVDSLLNSVCEILDEEHLVS